METVFSYIRRNRELFLELVDSLTLEQLNAVPAGFQNSIIWNLGHIAVSTPALCYVRTGVWPGSESIPFFEKYAKGTMHQGDADQAHVDFIKSYINELIDQLEKDYRSGALSSIQGFATHTYGLPMERIEEVITCTLAHDSLHLGYALAQRRALSI